MASQKMTRNPKSSYQYDYLPYDKRYYEEGITKHTQLKMLIILSKLKLIDHINSLQRRRPANSFSKA